MKLSIVTITCRENPRFEEMYRTLAGSLARCPMPLEVEWIIVDEKMRVPKFPLNEQLGIRVIAPLGSVARAQLDKDPAHNSARNAGLLAVSPDSDYIVFLNDCTIVTKAWFELVHDCAAQNLGIRCRTYVMHDIAIPADGAVTHRDHNDRLREVPPATVAGPCWGAPKRAFDQVGGFDLVYDGEDRGHDADAILRLARVGVRFICSERAFAVCLKRTKNRAEVSTRKAAFVGARNTKTFNLLAKDRHRIYPVVAHPELAARAGIPASAIAASNVAGGAHIVDHAAAPVKSGRVGPRGPKDPTALDDYIALCHDAHLSDGWTDDDLAMAKALWDEMRPNQKLIAGQKLGELVHDFIPFAPRARVARDVTVAPSAPAIAVVDPAPAEGFTPSTPNVSMNGASEKHDDEDEAPAETWLGD